ncbi:MAG: hypothetical protein HXX18_10080 [Bacteroidetes bacterium]|nr:hypothetical protein [Bacteroidota bacterium]
MKYLFFKLWQDFVGKDRFNKESNAFPSLIWLIVIQSTNIASLQLLLQHFFKIKDFLHTKIEIKIFAALLFIIIFLINYYFIYNRRNEIFDLYINENKNKSIIGKIILYLYMLGSFFIIYFISKKINI